MDMLAVDLSAVATIRAGFPGHFVGDGLSVDEVAHASGTIGYELLCALARVYLSWINWIRCRTHPPEAKKP